MQIYKTEYTQWNRLCLVKGENSTINDEWASYEKNVRFLGFIDLDFLWSKICVDFLKKLLTCGKSCGKVFWRKRLF